MKYNFDEVIDRRGTYSMKWDGGELIRQAGLTERFDADTIPLFTADMDFQCPQPVIDALDRVVKHRMYGYSTHLAEPRYFESIIHWFESRNGWKILPEEILYVNGTVEAVKLSILAFSDPGDGVILQRPVYSPFAGSIERTGRKLINNQLIHNDGYYTMDFEDLERKAKDAATKMLLLCSPHNPVGRVWNEEELSNLARICRENHVLIVADEIHGDLLRKGQKFIPIASIADNKNIVTCTAVNKTFNLAGLHCTNVVIKDAALRERYRYVTGMILPTPFTVAALVAAYSEGAEWLEQVKAYIDGNIDWLLNFLKEKMPKVKCFRSEGTYILWMDFRGYGLSAEEIHERIYNRANVVLEGGRIFDPDCGAGFERICVPTRRALLQEAMERIAREFEGL